MALFRKFFYRKPPDGLLEITERVYVFDSCFTTDVFDNDKYEGYIGDIVSQLRSHFTDASFMVFNFREGESQSMLENILSRFGMIVMDYPRQYEGCPLLTIEMIHHFLRSGESWLSLGQQNVLIMHCERGGWAVLAFMLAGLLLYRKQFIGEQRTLEMIYRQAPRELIQMLSPLNPMPSQIRYLNYISRRNVSSEWPPSDRALTLDCVILRNIPGFNGEGGCRPIFRIYGQDPLLGTTNTPKVLFSTPKRSKYVRLYKQADCDLIKIDIHCHIQGDVVLECISLDADQEREEMMFRVMFNTAFIRSNILMLNRDEIDILWDAKDRFPKDFRAEVLLSEMDFENQFDPMEVAGIGEKEGLPVEAFAKVQEMFSNVDWLDPKGDAAVQLFQQLTSSESIQLRQQLTSPRKKDSSIRKEAELDLGLISPINTQSDNAEDKLSNAENSMFYVDKPQNNSVQRLTMREADAISQGKPGSSFVHEKMSSIFHKKLTHLADINAQRPSFMEKTIPSTSISTEMVLQNQNAKCEEHYGSVQRFSPTTIMSQRFPVSRSSSTLCGNSSPRSLSACPRFHSAPSALGITALLKDHAASRGSENTSSTVVSPTVSNISSIMAKIPSKPSSGQHPTTGISVVRKGTPSQPSPPPPLTPVFVELPHVITLSEAKCLTQSPQKHSGISSSTHPSPHPHKQSIIQLHGTTTLPTDDQQSASNVSKESSPTSPAPLQLSLPTSSSISCPANIHCLPPDSMLVNASTSLRPLAPPPPPPPPSFTGRTSVICPAQPPHPPLPPTSSSIKPMARPAPRPPPPPPNSFLGIPPPSPPPPPSLASSTFSIRPAAAPPPSPPSLASTSYSVRPAAPPLPPPSLPSTSSSVRPAVPYPPPLPSLASTSFSVQPAAPPPPPPLACPSSPVRPATPLPPPPHTSTSATPPPPPPPLPLACPSSPVRPATPPPFPPTSTSSSVRHVAPPPPPPPPLGSTSSPVPPSVPPPPPPAPTSSVPPLPPPAPTSSATKFVGPPPPPTPCHSSKQSSNSMDKSLPPLPPPPALPLSHASSFSKDAKHHGGGCNGAPSNVIPPPAPPGGNAKLFGSKGHGPAPPSGPISKSLQSGQAVSRKSNLKPLHWVKVTRAMQGSLWADAQKADEALKAPVFDMSELENLFSAVLPNSDARRLDKSGSRSSGTKPEKIHLIDLRRANNCGIMLTKVKMPLPDLMSAILALDDTVLDADQVENLIKFTPTKEEIELLKGYKGDKQLLGECEQFFMELMKLPRVDSKLRVFSFKIQFRSQVSDLKRNLNIVNSSAEEIRGSAKLKRIMQTILSLGNALNQGTARGSAVGFRLDSLLKLSDTRARNNKMTLMHYLSKVLSEKLPELLDFSKDLACLELAAKIQLKSLAEEMQAINKGLEKVEQELTTSENDGPVSDIFRKTLKDFLSGAEAEVRALTSLYSNVGRNADALALYFGEDPARCPFEQVVITLQNFVRLFLRSHEENCKQLDLEKKKAQKESETEKTKKDSENEKAKPNNSIKELDITLKSPGQTASAK